MAVKLIDLSHSIEHGLITYKGLPSPQIWEHLTREESKVFYEAGTEFHIGKIEMVGNTGTYLDSPFHRYADGCDLAQLELSSLANLEGIAVRCTDRVITASTLQGMDVSGKAILFQTNWDLNWRTEKYSNGTHPFLAADTAEYLAEARVALVGIDSYNIDSTEDGRRPAHSILLGRGIPIVEHMCGLRELPDTGFRFFAVPVKVRRFGTFPVRAFSIVEE